jgi:thiol-disulfide isomerase/thioredoxin
MARAIVQQVIGTIISVLILLPIVVANTSGESVGMFAPTDNEIDPDSLPSVLECNRLEWLENCQQINRHAVMNPGAPLRVKDAEGLELNFPPGTPSSVIEAMLSPSPEASARVAERERKVNERAELAAQYGREAILARGDSSSLSTAAAHTVAQRAQYSGSDRRVELGAPEIDPEAAVVYVFYDTQCPSCLAFMPEVGKLTGMYPDLEVHALQIDENPAFLQSMQKRFRLNASMLDGEDRRAILSRLEVTPTTWVQLNNSDRTEVIEGTIDVMELARLIAEVTR